jgi:hypothetical protein
VCRTCNLPETQRENAGTLRRKAGQITLCPGMGRRPVDVGWADMNNSKIIKRIEVQAKMKTVLS